MNKRYLFSVGMISGLTLAVRCMTVKCELVINSGRVMDPESMYDDAANLGIKDGKIVFYRYNTMRPINKHNWFCSAKVSGSTVLAIFLAGAATSPCRATRCLMPSATPCWPSGAW